jgi:undecaprenyl diphosphate synthase
VSRDVPQHIGFILDGNRRWAKQHGLPTYEGHLAGYNALKDVIAAAADARVPYISFYSFSTQNWGRSEEEVRGIMSLVRRLFKSDIKQLVRDGYKVVVMGTRDHLPSDINEMIDAVEEVSKDGTKIGCHQASFGFVDEDDRSYWLIQQPVCQKHRTVCSTGDRRALPLWQMPRGQPY